MEREIEMILALPGLKWSGEILTLPGKTSDRSEWTVWHAGGCDGIAVRL